MTTGAAWRHALSRARAGSLDWLVVAAVAAVIYLVHGFHGGLTRDLGIFVYGAVQVAHGSPPYVENFNTVGPLADAVPGIGVALGSIMGVGPVLSTRLLFWVISAACCALVYVFARQLTHRRVGGFVAAALFLTFETFLDMATYGPREKTFMVFCLVGGFTLAGAQRWFRAGLAAGLATLTWQPALLPLAAGIGVMVLATERRWTNAARFVAGGVITAVAALAWFLAYGAVDLALKAFLVSNVRWVDQPSALDDPAASARLLWDGYHGSVLIVVAGVVVLAAAAALHRHDVLVVGAAVGAVVSVAWTLRAFNGTPDAFVVLPFGAAGSALGLMYLARRARRYGTVGAALVAALAAGAALTYSLGARAGGLTVDMRDVHAVLGTLPPTAALATINAPQPLVFSGRRNPEPYLILASGELGLLQHEWPGGLEGYVDQLLAGDPALLAIGPGPDLDVITGLVASRYARAGAGPGFDWYVARDEGHRLLRDVRRSNLRALELARQQR